MMAAPCAPPSANTSPPPCASATSSPSPRSGRRSRPSRTPRRVVAEGAPGAGAGIVTTSAHIAGAVAGVGGSEVARRELSDQEVADIVGNEIASLDSAAAEYERLGRPDHAGDLRHQAAVLRGHLGD